MPSKNPTPNLDAKLTERQLKIAYWYVSHKSLLKKTLIGFLMFLCLVFWGYGVYGLINYYFIEQPRFNMILREMTTPLIDYAAFRAKNQPQSFTILDTSILSSGKEKYDFAAKILNPNSKWRADFEYKFIYDGEETSFQKGSILPDEEKFLLALAVESKRKPRSISIELQNINWQRLDSHEISDYDSWSLEHLNFEITEVKFLPAVVRDKTTISKATFRADNKTAYSFWEVGFYILLYRGKTLAGVSYITLEQFTSGEVREVEVSWFEVLPTVTKVEVLPEVNIFNPGVYMPVE